MTARRKLAIAALFVVLLVTVLAQGGGNKTAHSLPRTDGWGDPFVTDAEFAAIRVGISDSEAFHLLGGQGSNGYYTNGAQYGVVGSVPGPAGVIDYYDYPIRGTGDPSPNGPDPLGLNDHTSWWRICVLDGKVVGKRRLGPSDDAVGCWG